MARDIGKLHLHDDGSITYEGPYRVVTPAELEMAFRAAVGAQAAMQADNPSESLTHLAASLLAKAGAAKARETRKAAAQAALA